MTVPFKIFFTTDIHGSERCFRKFINSAKFYDAQVLILGGDITGKVIIPILKNANKMYRAVISNRPREVAEDELNVLIEEIRFNGYYPYITTAEELAEIEADPKGKERLFRLAIKESLEKWFALAEERLKPLNIKVYISPGNDDDFIVDEVLKSSDFIINPEEKVVEIAPGVEMLTFGFANPTPWNSPRELSEEELEERLTVLADKMSYEGISIYNIHVPPFNTPIDQAPKLDSNLKPVVEAGQIVMTGVGSKAVRNLIMKYQPTLGLHGHVHESAGIVRLGKTVCINPGSEYNDGVLRGALITIDEKKKKISYQLTVG
ncbi:MAG TPA: metallophosphoesterase [Thermoanaerobacter sp.]|nr:metallophosphoesterase [Thermoanaerobacter sp.]